MRAAFWGLARAGVHRGLSSFTLLPPRRLGPDERGRIPAPTVPVRALRRLPRGPDGCRARDPGRGPPGGGRARRPDRGLRVGGASRRSLQRGRPRAGGDAGRSLRGRRARAVPGRRPPSPHRSPPRAGCRGPLRSGKRREPGSPLLFGTEDLLREAAHAAEAALLEDALGPLDRPLEAAGDPERSPRRASRPAKASCSRASTAS